MIGVNVLENPYNKHVLESFMVEFSQATDLAAVLVDIYGKEISGYSKFSEFCEIIRSKPEYRHLCQKCDLLGGLESSKKGHLVCYKCHAGLLDFSMPIIVHNQIVGFMMFGQIILTDEKQCCNCITCEQTNINASVELQRAFTKVKRINKAKLDAAISLLDKMSSYYLTKELGKSDIEISIKPPIPAPANYEKTFYKNEEIQKALQYIDKNLHKNIQLEEIANHVYLSHYYFSKLFKKEMSINFITYVNQKKVERAKTLLLESQRSVEHIARDLGFKQPSYFCKIFKNFIGITPAEFRTQNKNSYTFTN